MSRKRGEHKPLNASFIEVLEKVAKGKGATKKAKKKDKKPYEKAL